MPLEHASSSGGPVLPGQLLARGVCRQLTRLGFVCLEEFSPARGKRVDVIAMDAKGTIWIVECKSCRADFQSDQKWQGYLDWCDRYFWAVDAEFPTGLLPEDTGLILADGYGAEILREGPENRLSGARRKALILSFARAAAARLQSLRDPAANLG